MAFFDPDTGPVALFFANGDDAPMLSAVFEIVSALKTGHNIWQ
jgi:hypothetical protein